MENELNKPKIIKDSGSSFDSFLDEEGLFEHAEAVAIKRVIAWQRRTTMKQEPPSKYNTKRTRAVLA